MKDFFQDTVELPDSVEISSATKFDVFENPSIKGFDIKLPEAELQFSECFFSRKLSDRMIDYLQELESEDWRNINWPNLSPEQLENLKFKNINWKQDYIKFFGKTHPLPRLTSWYGDPGASYEYSGIQSDPNPWNDRLIFVKSKIEEALGVRFNSVLLNWYRDGSDSLNWHADDEKELGVEPIIASANFGSPRDFLFRRKDNKDVKLAVKLKHGSLLVMRGKTQEQWVHSVPKRSGRLGTRFNLTFRQIQRSS